MTCVDLVYSMAKRAKDLSDEKIDVLRVILGTQDTPRSAVRENRHRKRGEMIEEILVQEFEDRARWHDDRCWVQDGEQGVE